jgi:hypothetical protein
MSATTLLPFRPGSHGTSLVPGGETASSRSQRVPLATMKRDERSFSAAVLITHAMSLVIRRCGKAVRDPGEPAKREKS